MTPSLSPAAFNAPEGRLVGEHASALVGRLTCHGLRAVTLRCQDGVAGGALAVRAWRTDAAEGCVVVLLPTRRGLQWHWERPLVGYRDRSYRWYQPFCAAGEDDRAAAAVAARLARQAHLPQAPHLPVGAAAESVAESVLRQGSGAGFGAGGEVTEQQLLDSIARPQHTLVWRMLEALNETLRTVEDPVLLHRLFGLDHLVVRALRGLERLAVLSGATARQLPDPLALSLALRQAAAGVSDYRRVRVPPAQIEVDLVPDAAAEIMLLLSELLENATLWSPPDTDVLLTAARTETGVRIEVADRGLPIAPEKRAALEQMLAAPEAVSVSEQIVTGPIGLLVVALLARRHQVRVELHPHDGGTRAVVELPAVLLREPPPALTAAPPPTMAAIAPGSTAGPAGTRAARPGSPPPDWPQRPDHGIGQVADPPNGLGDGASAGEPSPLPRRPTARAPSRAPSQSPDAANDVGPHAGSQVDPDVDPDVDPAVDFLQGVHDHARGRSCDRSGGDPPGGRPVQ